MEWSYWISILTLAGIACIAAVGLYVTMSTGQLSMGHAALFGVGAYTSGVLTVRGVSFWLALVVALLVCGLLGLVVAALIVRLHHWFLSIATLGMGEFVQVVVLNNDWLGGGRGLQGVPLETNVGLVYAALAITIVIVWRLDGSRIGYGYRLTRHDDVVAAALGVDVRRERITSFGLGAVFAGLAGVLYIHYVGIIVPASMGFERSLDFLMYVAIGGVNTVFGPVVGAFLLTLLPELLRFSLAGRYAIFGLCLTIVVLVRPEGLLSRRAWNGESSIVDRIVGVLWPTYASVYMKQLRATSRED